MIENLNDDRIKDAINGGINREAVQATLESMVRNSEKLGYTPKQISEVVSLISEMKSKTNEQNNEAYLSNLVRNNSSKIKAALNDGISPGEIAVTLMNSIISNPQNLSFLTKLISVMKEKEIKLAKKDSYQKVYINDIGSASNF